MKPYKQLIFLVMLLSALVVRSSVWAEDAFSVEWQKTFGGSGNSQINEITATSDGGFIAVGLTDSTDGDIKTKERQQPEGSVFREWEDLLVVKFNASGTAEWHRTLGGTGNEVGYSVKQLEDGSYIIAGMAQSKDKDVKSNMQDSVKSGIWILNLSGKGEVLWEKVLKDIKSGIGSVEKLIVTEDGYIIGAQGSRGNFYEAYVVMLDRKGSVQWQKAVPGFYLHDICQLQDGSFLTAGNFLVNIDREGRINWQKESNQQNQRVCGTEDGGFVWAMEIGEGHTGMISDHESVAVRSFPANLYAGTGVNSNTLLMVAKYDKNGRAQWANYLGGSGDDRIGDLRRTADGGYIIAAATKSKDGDIKDPRGDADAWLAKLSAAGALEWQKSLGGSREEWPVAVMETGGGFVAASNTNSNDGDVSGLHNPTKNRAYDWWIVKLGQGGGTVRQGGFPSAWAKADVEAAKGIGLVSNNLLGNYQEKITREDFSELIVRLYEAITGQKALLPETGPFTDTVNPNVLKAYRLGVIDGMSDKLFMPQAAINREQAAVTYYRLILKIKTGLDTQISDKISFADQKDISGRALEAMEYTAYRGIITSTGANRIDPKGALTREQAIIQAKRIYDKIHEYVLDEFKFNNTSPVVVSVGDHVTLSVTVKGKDFSDSEKAPKWKVDDNSIADLGGTVIGGYTNWVVGEIYEKWVMTADYNVVVTAKKPGKTRLTVFIGAGSQVQSRSVEITVK